MGWKWWVNAYFRVLFSREIWFSWYFIILGFLLFLGLFEEEYTHWSGPILKALKGITFLFVVAILFTSAGCFVAWFKIRDRRRVERETAERMAYAREHIQSTIQATTPVEEPKQSPWYLGVWAKYLEEGNDKRN